MTIQWSNTAFATGRSATRATLPLIDLNGGYQTASFKIDQHENISVHVVRERPRGRPERAVGLRRGLLLEKPEAHLGITTVVEARRREVDGRACAIGQWQRYSGCLGNVVLIGDTAVFPFPLGEIVAVFGSTCGEDAVGGRILDRERSLWSSCRECAFPVQACVARILLRIAVELKDSIIVYALPPGRCANQGACSREKHAR